MKYYFERSITVNQMRKVHLKIQINSQLYIIIIIKVKTIIQLFLNIIISLTKMIISNLHHFLCDLFS